MKNKTYLAPQIDVVELQIEDAILNQSTPDSANTLGLFEDSDWTLND
ncbi:MAG: hypothetical protein SNI70_09735 [Rikenellaceae bacterium]